jgi:GNAT superfamily N-acetyltransferase
MLQGIGRALIVDAVANARALRVPRIEVTANDHALPFYLRVGFVVDGVSQTRLGPAHRMHLDEVHLASKTS